MKRISLCSSPPFFPPWRNDWIGQCWYQQSNGFAQLHGAGSFVPTGKHTEQFLIKGGSIRALSQIHSTKQRRQFNPGGQGSADCTRLSLRWSPVLWAMGWDVDHRVWLEQLLPQREIAPQANKQLPTEGHWGGGRWCWLCHCFDHPFLTACLP